MLERRILPIGEPSLKRQKIALGLAFLVIVLVSMLAFFTTQRLIAAVQRIEQTQSILIETNRFLSELKDVESAARGYLISGDRRYLHTHSIASEQAVATASRLRRLERGRPLAPRLDRLMLLADRRIAASRMVISQRDSPIAARNRCGSPPT